MNELINILHRRGYKEVTIDGRPFMYFSTMGHSCVKLCKGNSSFTFGILQIGLPPTLIWPRKHEIYERLEHDRWIQSTPAEILYYELLCKSVT